MVARLSSNELVYLARLSHVRSSSERCKKYPSPPGNDYGSSSGEVLPATMLSKRHHVVCGRRVQHLRMLQTSVCDVLASSTTRE